METGWIVAVVAVIFFMILGMKWSRAVMVVLLLIGAMIFLKFVFHNLIYILLFLLIMMLVNRLSRPSRSSKRQRFYYYRHQSDDPFMSEEAFREFFQQHFSQQGERSYQQGGYTHATSSLQQAYRYLEVSETASDIEVKKAYKRKAREYHPDMYAQKTLQEREVAESHFKAINEAYRLIKRARPTLA